MAAPVFSEPLQPYVYQSAHAGVTPFQILDGEAQVVQLEAATVDSFCIVVIALPDHVKVTREDHCKAWCGECSREKITCTMCYMSGSIQMDNIYLPEHEGGMWQWLFGKSVTSIDLFNTGSDDGFVGIAAQSPARILPIDLANFGGEILCQIRHKPRH